ncbi:hypothetical protein HN51_011910 [Arachis hypogaea]|uniref:Amine oxidase domain-containing protein n=1 Tax=Arachis hypogaea TaxID=3818 RepID=A0A445DX77_ARAHY|nr:probable polyamine oxidase 5 [Arachis hypogaea]QHO57297.1 putative polyamine oxidase [Arachis hypogaea]RYR67709.1 hypothetical protein Ahy_A03g014103 [Arachis hypogaea]
MVVKKPRIVIIGAGMAGLTAANKLYTATASKDLFELCVVEGGTRIGGRINTSEFGGDRIEMGATWIHGIGGSPIHKIAQEIHSLHSDQPWECMDGDSEELTTVAEGGFQLQPSIVDPITKLFKHLMDYSQGKMKLLTEQDNTGYYHSLAAKAFSMSKAKSGSGGLSVGSFLREGLDAYWGSVMKKGHDDYDDDDDDDDDDVKGYYGNWTRKLLEEAIFAMHENTQRTYTSAGNLMSLDYRAESEYIMFPDEEITIAKGYLSIIEHLASVLPPGLIQLGRKVTKIEWQPQNQNQNQRDIDEGGRKVCVENGGSCCSCSRPVKLHFSDGSSISADHVIVTVSLGVLKAAIRDHDKGDSDSGMFCPPLPPSKAEAISRLGFGVVNKLFMQLSPTQQTQTQHHVNHKGFPFLQMAFHSPHSEMRHKKIPWWMRRTATLFPIYNNSTVLLSWFAGEEALALESLKDEEIINGVSTTVSSLLSHSQWQKGSDSHKLCNGIVNSSEERYQENEVRFSSVMKSKWGTDPLFLGSYSYVAVGSSGDDLDTMAEPLPKDSNCHPSASSYPLQILFAGEATHRTHYSTTHGAYFSGLREANRLLQHYHCVGIYNN